MIATRSKLFLRKNNETKKKIIKKYNKKTPLKVFNNGEMKEKANATTNQFNKSDNLFQSNLIEPVDELNHEEIKALSNGIDALFNQEEYHEQIFNVYVFQYQCDKHYNINENALQIYKKEESCYYTEDEEEEEEDNLFQSILDDSMDELNPKEISDLFDGINALFNPEEYYEQIFNIWVFRYQFDKHYIINENALEIYKKEESCYETEDDEEEDNL